ncbi:MAG: hypothetical protein PVH65_11300 [Chloroflexota bacterium]|jgi:hypothetical protein
MKTWLWNGKPWQAFKNFALIFSFVLNLIFLVLLILGALYIIPVMNDVAEPVVSGLNDSFEDMGNAHIRERITINEQIPVVFDLPVQTNTVATILEPVPMSIPTQFVLPGGGGYINGNVSFSLPAGTGLPVQLDVVVPVSQSVPIVMEVPVDIPLSETELSQPFGDLRRLFAPLDSLLSNLPSSNSEAYQRLMGNAGDQAQVVPAEQAGATAVTP